MANFFLGVLARKYEIGCPENVAKLFPKAFSKRFGLRYD